MQATETPQTDPAAGVVPTPRPSPAWRVVAVEPLPELRLRVTFVDGTCGEVWLRKFLESEQVSGTMFEPLRAPEIFQQVRVELGAVTWPNGADLAPDAMYDTICAQGHWVVEAY
jgi:uncharacterized protein DUF2442